MAKALGVSVEDLLIGETGKAAGRKAAKSDAGQREKCVRSSIVSQSSRGRQQEHIVNWVSAYVSQYEQTRQS